MLLLVIAEVPLGFEVDQESVYEHVLAPDAMEHEPEVGVREPDGGGFTFTVTLLLPDPPGPVQVTVYEVFVVNAPVPNEPDEPP